MVDCVITDRQIVGSWLRLERLRMGEAPLRRSMWLSGHLQDKT